MQAGSEVCIDESTLTTTKCLMKQHLCCNVKPVNRHRTRHIKTVVKASDVAGEGLLTPTRAMKS